MQSLVTSDPNVRFYPAAPLLTDDGYALGVVCIVDHVPRQLTDSQLGILKSLGRLAMEQIELRSKLDQLGAVEEQDRFQHQSLRAAGESAD